MCSPAGRLPDLRGHFTSADLGYLLAKVGTIAALFFSCVSARTKQNNEIRAQHRGGAQEMVAVAIPSRPAFGS